MATNLTHGLLPSDAERAARLAEAMTADPGVTPPGDPWTVQDVIGAAIARGLAAMEAQYLPGGAR